MNLETSSDNESLVRQMLFEDFRRFVYCFFFCVNCVFSFFAVAKNRGVVGVQKFKARILWQSVRKHTMKMKRRIRNAPNVVQHA